MRVLCAPDSFKDSMTAAVAARTMALGARDADPTAEVDECPMSDGGEGFRATLAANLGGKTTEVEVTGPLGDPLWAGLTLLPARGGEPLTAVVEMAEASGLELVQPTRRDPTITTTRGTGEMIRAALDRGARRILLGIGGSATCDGGAGLAQALGFVFLDGTGRRLDAPMSGGALGAISRIVGDERDARLDGCEIRVACDVTNPLLGDRGAAEVYAPQKGATPEQVRSLEAGLGRLADAIRRDLGRDVAAAPGAGAAGGLGAGAIAFLGARLVPGVDLVLEAVGFDGRLAGCDICLTGEGRLDEQTLWGKVVHGVTRAAARRGVRTIALVGDVGAGADRMLAEGLAAYRVIGGPIERGPERLCAAAAEALRAI